MRQLPDTQKQASKLLDQAQKILCITHAKSGGDGVMAVLAAQQWLSAQEKEVKAVFPSQVPAHFSFLPGLEVLESEFSRQGNLVISVAGAEPGQKLDYSIGETGNMSITLPANKEDVVMRQEEEKYDLILCFEVGDLSDLGSIYTDQIDFFQTTPLINMAANGHNEFYSKINLVDPTKSSVSEMLYELISTSNPDISPELATVLLTGVMAGSESFLGENTTASAFAVASKLQALGATQSDIIENLYKKKSLRTLKLWGQVFSRLEFDQNHRIARSTLHKSDFEMLEVAPEQIENLTKDILRFVDGSDVFVLFYEYGDTITAQIRTGDTAFDWKRITEGHPFEVVEGGIDLDFPGAYLSDIEKKVFKSLLDYQIDTKALNPDLKVVLKHCEPADFQTEPATDQGQATREPKAPESIPFEAPLQPHESAPAASQGEAKKDWIKKNFPAN